MKNFLHLLKTKGTRECIEAIGRIYGVDQNYLKASEYSIFHKPQLVRETEEVDVPVLFSTGDVYCQVPTGTISAFDFASSANFTIEARVSITSAITNSADHKILVHPKYNMLVNKNGQLIFRDTLGTSAITTQSSISSFIKGIDNFVNVAAVRNNNTLNVYILALSGSGSGSENCVVMSSGTTSNVAAKNFYSSAGLSSFGAYFPGSGSFSGYMHEVRIWDVALDEKDLVEHTRNFESTSFINSTASNSATYGSLKAHYRLKENIVLTSDYNFIVDSTTSSNTAIPINFNNQINKRYFVFQNMEKIVYWYPSGLAVDNDKIHQTNPEDDIEDQTYLSFNLSPINALNRYIKNKVEKINIIELLGDPEDIYLHSYTGPIATTFNDIVTQFGRTNDLVDYNTFIKATNNFNDVMGGMFSFLKQFVPAKCNILSEGIFIEDHILHRNKYQRERFSSDVTSVTSRSIDTHHNIFNTSVSSATTAEFQGYKYYEAEQQSIINSISSDSRVSLLTARTGESINKPSFSTTRVGRMLPVKVSPSNPEDTEIEVTMNRLSISPTASPSAYNGYINSKIRLLRRGIAFKTDIPALQFEFPSSSDGTNYFIAEIGDIDNGKGRIVSGKDTSLLIKTDISDVQMKLQLDNIIRSLSTDTVSLSGTIGIVPIRIKNMFSNASQVIRIAIGNDPSLVNEIAGQGGVKIVS